MSQITDHALTYGGAGVQEFQSQGQFLRIRSATSTVYLAVDGRPEIEAEQGEQINLGSKGRRVRVRSAIAQTVKVRSSSVSQDDNRAAVSLSTTTTIDPSNNISGVAKKTVSSGGSINLVAGNANRVRLIIKVPSDQLDGVWLGGAASSSGNGDFIEPGERLILGTVAAVWAYGNGVSDVDVSITEEEII